MTKQKIPLERAREIAIDLVNELRPYCERIEIAGSVRRGKAEVGDIEICAIPKDKVDMFGAGTGEHQLDEVDWHKYGKVIKNGHKYKQIELPAINLDLFIVTFPAQWGVQFIIRTGSADYSHRFVTPKSYGGLMPAHLHVKNGAIWCGDKLVETPEEEDVYRLIGEKWIAPQERTA